MSAQNVRMLSESRGDIFITPNIGPFLLFLVAEYSEGFYDLPCHPDLIFPSAVLVYYILLIIMLIRRISLIAFVGLLGKFDC